MADPGFPVGGGVDLVQGAVDPRGGYISKILHVKTKESGPVGGGAPRSANEIGCVDLLIKAGADVNITSPYGRFGYSETALIAAILYSSLPCAKLLLKSGGHVNVKNSYDSSAVSDLLNYHRFKKPDIIMTLIPAGERIELAMLNTEDFDFLQNLESNLELKHLCRKGIRKYLMDLQLICL